MRLKKLSTKQREIFHFCTTDETTLICDGSVRSGKTTVMTLAFLAWAMENHDRTNFAICGKTVQAAERNILRPLMEVEGLGAALALSYKVSTRVLTVRCGDKCNWFYLFGGKDESSYMLIQGITLAGVLFDEVALMPQSFVEQAMARAISFERPKYFFNCNPESPANWVYKKFIERVPENTRHIHFLLEDNPILTPQMIERTKAMYSGVFYDRYIRGIWVVAEGLVYPMFGESCIVDELPDEHAEATQGTEAKPTPEYYISCDYGTMNPFSAGVWRWDGKTATRIREYYYSGRETQQSKTDEEYFAEIEKLRAGLKIKYMIVDPSAASFIEVLRRHKYPVRKAKNDVRNGIMTTARYLQDGTVKIHRSCTDAIREFGLYRWDEKAGEDQPIKENDHAMDDIRYFCYTVLREKAGRTEYRPIWNR